MVSLYPTAAVWRTLLALMYTPTRSPLLFKTDYCELAVCYGDSFLILLNGIWPRDVPVQMLVGETNDAKKLPPFQPLLSSKASGPTRTDNLLIDQLRCQLRYGSRMVFMKPDLFQVIRLKVSIKSDTIFVTLSLINTYTCVVPLGYTIIISHSINYVKCL